MSAITLTVHAKRRLQQRAIPEEAIELLMQFGSADRSHGAERVFFDKTARRRLKREMSADAQRRGERYTNIYAVVSDAGAVITAGYRTKRFHRH